jgi:hypothetical protein
MERLRFLVEEKKKEMGVRKGRVAEKNRVDLRVFGKEEEPSEKDEDEKRLRRRVNTEKLFRGVEEDEAERDLEEIFQGQRKEKRIYLTDENKRVTLIKGEKISEGDYVQVGKGDALERGRVKCINRNRVVIEMRGKEKKYLLSKLHSPRYTITRISQ